MANVTQVTLAADSRQIRRSTRDLNKMQRQGTMAQASVKKLGAALIAIGGATAVIRGIANLSGQFLSASRESESFRLRLNILLGSVSEGNRAFEDMAEFAGKVPFEYREIMSSATQLAGVMDGGVDQINKWMPMIADLAAVSGLSIEKTTEQVVRMYSAGAGAADLFRERGITAMLGFEAGVSHSAEETRKKLIEAFEDPQSQFRGAADELAGTWDGMLSMISDSWFQFRDDFMQDTVMFDFLKAGLNEFRMNWDSTLDQNQKTLNDWAQGVITTIEFIGVGFTTLWDVAMAPKRIFDAVVALGQTVVTWLLKPLNAIGAVSDELFEAFQFNAEESRRGVDRLNTTTDNFLKTMQEVRLNAQEAFGARQLNLSVEDLIANNEDLFGAQKRVTQAMGETGSVGTEAMQDIGKEIDNLIKKDELFASEWMDNLKDRLESTEDALRTELEALEDNRREQLEVIEAAEREGLRTTMTFAEMRRRVEEDFSTEKQKILEDSNKKMIEETEDAASQWDKIWDNAIENMQSAFGDTIYDALWEDGIDSFDDFADAMLDIWKRMIAEMVAAWITSGIAGMFSEGNLSGFSIGGGSGGNILTTGASAAAKKFFGGASTTSGAGGSAAGGAQAFALGEQAAPISGTALSGGGVTTLGGANSFLGGGGGISGASVTGGSAGAGLGGAGTSGTAAGAGTAGMGAMGVAGGMAIFAAGVMALQAAHGASSRDKVLKDLERAGPGVAGGLGLQAAAGDKFGFARGANAGFAADFAKRQGFRANEIMAGGQGTGIAAFKDLGLEDTINLLDAAQKEFEDLKKSAQSAFKLGQEGAMQIGQSLQDGVIDQTELADMGFIALGERITNTKSGVEKMGNLAVEKFDAITKAVNDGTFRLAALRGETRLNATEMQFLGQQGLMASQSVQAGFQSAQGSVRSFGSASAAALRQVEGAANNAAGAVARIGTGGEGPRGAASRDHGLTQQLRNDAQRNNQKGR